ncbi:MAG TPA: transcription termination factor NusA [Anaerolineales bacterium]|nr:transcription termination factor NusA [Anaerolineales bacterium]
MKSEFILAFNEVLEHYGLPREVVLSVLETALVNAYRRAVNASNAQQVEAKVDITKGTIQIFAEKEIVEDVQDERTEVTLTDAQLVDPKAELGGLILVESTPKDFGRIATQTAKQIVHQRLRDAERDKQFDEWSARKGEIVHGTIQAVGAQAVTVTLGRAEAVLPKREQLPTERYRPRDRIRAYLLDVSRTPRGPQITLSRADRSMLRRLLEAEVPEIYQGMVEIKGIAREPGIRSKVAVTALQANLDPVGACVGMRGGRIQAIVRELHDEKIDVIEWNPDPAAFIAKALSPARVAGVYLDDDPQRGKTALVVVSEDQLSLAIGREGVNARLGAKLTGWRIDIKSIPEATSDALAKLTSDPGLAELAEQHAELVKPVSEALAKKAEGRPLPPEDYQAMEQLVSLVESALSQQRESRRKAQARRLAEIRKNIPQPAYEIPLSEIGLDEPLVAALTGAGLTNIAQAFEQLTLDPDSILGLPEVGARSLEDLRSRLQTAILSAKVVEPEPVAVEVAAEAPDMAEGAPVAAQAAGAEGAPAEAVAETTEAGEAPALPGTLPTGEVVEEEAEEEEGGTGKKKKGKKKKQVTLVLDPDLGVTVAHRTRKASRLREWDPPEE